MSTLTEIERALQSIDPAGFQRLCDAYLFARGYRDINPIGLVVGTDKVKRGTPDSLVTLPNGNYAFAEHTTQQTGVAEKLLDDMAKCFDEAKTGIPANRIQQFIACHTSVLSPDEEHKLIEEGRRRGCLVTVFGLGPIAHDLLQRFAGLARRFLGVELDTGQILTLDEFVAAYGKNALATPLDTTIRFRDEAIHRATTDLDAYDVLIVAGAAGVGKSRLALEICRRFTERHPDTQARSVLYRGIDLFQDVRTYFATPGLHLVFVDDANRVSGFEHVLHLLHEQSADRQVKIVATVRDYALTKVADGVRPYGSAPVLMLGALKDEQIRDIVVEDFEITNHRYYERIVDIAQGNARLAVMAARVAKRDHNLASLANVSALYDEYFGSIRKDITELHDTEILRAAGILAVFRHVDRKNEEQMAVISAVFQLTPDQLWRAVLRLHHLELVDLYEDEVARLSDQVLATYLFHLAFFGQRVLDPGSFFHPAFFPHYKARLFDALNPAANAFDGEAIATAIRPSLKHRWLELEAREDEESLLHLVNAFGTIEETAALTYLRDRISSIPAERADLSSLAFKAAATPGLSLWTVLGTLRDNGLPVIRMTVALALELLARRPIDTPHALHLLTERLGMRHSSYLEDYEVQSVTIEELWSRIRAPDGTLDELIMHLFLSTAEPLLRTHAQTHETKGERTITLLTFDLVDTPALRSLRHRIWQHIGQLLNEDRARPYALDFVRAHARDWHQVTDPDLLASDATITISLLAQGLDPSSYTDCVVAQAYLQLLEYRNVALNEMLEEERAALQSRFTSRTYQLAALLLDDYEDRQERAEIGWREYEAQKCERLREYVAGCDLAALDQLISDCAIIRDDLNTENEARGEPHASGHKEWQLKRRMTTMIQAVAERDAALFVQFIDCYLKRGDPIELEPQDIVPLILAAAGVDQAYEILISSNSPRRGAWLTGLFVWLPEEAVTQDWLGSLYAHYEGATVADLFRDVDFLSKYERLDLRVVPKVVGTLVTKARTNPRVGQALADTFDAQGTVGSRLREIFGGSPEDIALLREAYFAASLGDPHFDYNAAAFSVLLDLDPHFGRKWIDWRYMKSAGGYLSRHDESRDYSDLWLRPDYMAVMRSLLARIQENQRFEFFSYADVYVARRNDEPRRDEISRRQRELFLAWVADSAEHIDQMTFVFARATSLPHEHRRELLASFLAKNHRYSDFERLPLEPSGWSWSGSEVPLLQKRIEFLESILPLFDRVDLLDHRKRVERCLAGLGEELHVAKRRDFLER